MKRIGIHTRQHRSQTTIIDTTSTTQQQQQQHTRAIHNIDGLTTLRTLQQYITIYHQQQQQQQQQLTNLTISGQVL